MNGCRAREINGTGCAFDTVRRRRKKERKNEFYIISG